MTVTSERAVLFADVVGSTALYRELGDQSAETLIRQALERVTQIAQGYGGRLIKTIGDCALCEFETADAAARTALDVQRRAHAAYEPCGRTVFFRIGFMLGPVVPRDDDIFGDAVNIAARLCDMAKVHQVLTTEASAATMAPDLRSNVRLFDQTPVKGVSENLIIVQLMTDRRAATQIFTAPTAMLMPKMGSIVLRYGGQTIALSAAQMPFTIGREEGCRLVVPSPFASREHARIEVRRGKFLLVDESTNGTYVLPDGADQERFVYLRRESFALLGKGVFALGERPDVDAPHLLQYEVSEA